MPYLVPMAEPIYFVCNQPGCAYQDIVRPIWPRRIGDGMFELAAISCECSPGIEMRRVAAPEAAAIEDPIDVHHQWVLDEALVGSEPPC